MSERSRENRATVATQAMQARPATSETAGAPLDGGPGAILDDPQSRASVDPSGMLAAIAAMPQQLRSAAGRTAEIVASGPGPSPRPRAVLVLGMGGSAIGADIVRTAFDDRLRVPLVVHREHGLPGWVDRETLVVASSHSGRTEETLRAFRAALDLGARTAAITTGGTLADVAAAAGAQVVRFEAPGQPRAAVGHGAGLLAIVLAGFGVLDIDAAGELNGAADAIDRELSAHGPTVPVGANPAKRLAATLADDRLVVVLGADHLESVARRWKTQLNENAKVWADWDEYPELDHNSVVGFGAPSWTRERLFVVSLVAQGESDRVRERREAVLELLRESGTDEASVEIRAGHPFAQAFAGILIGDLVSVYVALLRGVDPTPVDSIARLKVRLSGGPTGP